MMSEAEFKKHLGYMDTLRHAMVYLRNQFSVSMPPDELEAHFAARDILSQATISMTIAVHNDVGLGKPLRRAL